VLSLLIVDDEKLIREGLVTYIDWSSLGIEVAGVCATAAEALRRVRQSPVDLVLPGVRMPGMDGIDLLKQVKEISPGSEVVFISAYRSFEYARSALHFGAFDYVAKPIEEAALYDTMRRCVAHHERSRGAGPVATREGLREELRHHLLSGLAEPAVWQRLAADLGVAPAGGMYLEVVISADGEAGQRAGEEAERRAALLQPAGAQVLTLDIGEREAVIMAFGAGGAGGAGAEPPAGFCAGWSSRPAAHDPLTLYAEASWAVAALAVHRGRTRISWEEVRSRLASHPPAPISAAEAVEELLGELVPETTDQSWRVCAPLVLSSAPGDPAALRLAAARFAEEVIDELDRYPSLGEAVAGLETLHARVVRERSPHGIVAAARAWLDALSALVRRRLPPGVSRRIADAVNLVRDDPRSAATLADVARQLQVSPGYLSRTFRAEMEESFTTFRSRVRIEKACELLRDHRSRVYEVADLVGFNDVTHFTRVFTRITGQSPSDYRRGAGRSGDRPAT
jgi:two-component system, response regulator YesN